MYFQRKWELVSNIVVAVCMIVFLCLPLGCSSDSLTSWLSSNSSSATIAAVAEDVADVLAAVDEDTTNAELLAAVLATVPNKYTQFFSAIITVLEAAVETDEAAATDTTEKVLLKPRSLNEIRALRTKARANVPSKKIDAALLQYLQEQSDKIQNSHDNNPFSFRGRTASPRLEMVETPRGASGPGTGLSMVQLCS